MCLSEIRIHRCFTFVFVLQGIKPRPTHQQGNLSLSHIPMQKGVVWESNCASNKTLGLAFLHVEFSVWADLGCTPASWAQLWGRRGGKPSLPTPVPSVRTATATYTAGLRWWYSPSLNPCMRLYGILKYFILSRSKAVENPREQFCWMFSLGDLQSLVKLSELGAFTVNHFRFCVVVRNRDRNCFK